MIELYTNIVFFYRWITTLPDYVWYIFFADYAIGLVFCGIFLYNMPHDE